MYFYIFFIILFDIFDMYFHFSFIYFCSVQLELWQSNNMTEHHTGFHVLTQNVTTQAITSLWKRLVIIPVVIPVRWQQCHYTILEFIQHYSSQHVLVWFLWKQSLTVTQRGNSIKTVVGHIEVTLDLVCFVLSVIVYILHPLGSVTKWLLTMGHLTLYCGLF